MSGNSERVVELPTCPGCGRIPEYYTLGTGKGPFLWMHETYIEWYPHVTEKDIRSIYNYQVLQATFNYFWCVECEESYYREQYLEKTHKILRFLYRFVNEDGIIE